MIEDDNSNYTVGAQGLAEWVKTKTMEWRDHYESNYEEKHDEYYRLWRGIWSGDDKMRDSERSRLIAPALQQAVESSVAEIEEATFGRGKFFDIEDDLMDENKQDIEMIKRSLEQDFKYTKTRKSVAECILNAAIYGTGIGELVIEEAKHVVPAQQPIMEGSMKAVGTMTKERFVTRLIPIQPHNFLIDPVATSVEEALGCAVERFVPTHYVEQMMEQGIYRDIPIGTASPDDDLDDDKELYDQPDDKVKLTKYYGLIPRWLFNQAIKEEAEEEGEEFEDLSVDEDDEEGYVEAIVILANDELVKVEENPYMLQDRPIVSFPWDVVPNRFWGRGICEKGYSSQKALDTELRARIDALALTVHPMMAVDASRLPRGMKPEVRPGKIFLTNGNPAEILQPFKFGGVDQVTFAQSQKLEQMVQQATGAIDSSGVAGGVNNEAAASSISMSLGAIIKRHKRTLINFQEMFLIPMIEKTAFRYMQYDPERYPAQDFTFTASSSLGIMAREYEVTQLIQLMQTMPQDNPAYPLILESIIDNMNLSNREEILATLKQAQQPNPEAQKAQQEAQQIQVQQQQATIAALQAQAESEKAKGRKYDAEAQTEQFNAESDRIRALATNITKGNSDDEEFERRLKVADRAIKMREVKTKENK